MLDVFKQNAFGVLSLTDAINKIPFIPGRAGAVIDWNEAGSRPPRSRSRSATACSRS
jgi:hypothetical protein